MAENPLSSLLEISGSNSINENNNVVNVTECSKDNDNNLNSKANSKDKGKGKALIKKTKNTRSTVPDCKPSTSKSKSDIEIIKEQLKSLIDIVPVVQELKQAYDSYNEVEEGSSTPHIVTVSQDIDLNRSNNENEVEADADSSLDYFKGVAGTVVPTGHTIHDDIATGVATILEKGIDSRNKEELFQKYETPSNCSRLKSIQCNTEVLKMVSNNTRMRDTHLLKVQDTLLKGLSATVEAFDKLNDNMSHLPEEGKNATKTIADAIALLAHSSHQLDISRRFLFKGELKEEFSSLCNDSYPVHNLLFGEQLPEKIKDVFETQKMSQKMAKTRFEPYNINARNNNKRFPFLGQRIPFWKRRGGGQRQVQQRQSHNYNYNKGKKQSNRK